MHVIPEDVGIGAAFCLKMRSEEVVKDGGRGRTRTDMRLPSADFESAVAANFTTRPLGRLYRNDQETSFRCTASVHSALHRALVPRTAEQTGQI